MLKILSKSTTCVRWAIAFVLIPALLAAQNAPLTGTTIKSTAVSVVSLCVGCPLGSSTPVINSKGRMAGLSLQPLAAPADPANTLYNKTGGVLTWQGPVSVTTGGPTLLTGTVSIGSGFGSGAAVVGQPYGFKVSVGTTPGSSGLVQFSTNWAQAPICTVSSGTSVGATSTAYLEPGTSGIFLITDAGPWANNSVFYVTCFGY